MRLSRRWARAGSAKCIVLGIRDLGAMLPSRFYLSTYFLILT
jgi:hypothetical protein